MMLALLGLFALLASLPGAFAQTPDRPTRVQAGLTLRVDDRDAAATAAVAAAEAAGGWFNAYSTEAVSLRVPVAKSDALITTLRGLGDLIERSYQSDDLSAQVVDLESRLAARRAMLGKYLEVLGSASPKAIVAVEREVSQLVSEIEGLEGQLRFLRDRADYAAVSVSFVFRDRQGPRRDGSSSFAWMNSINLADLLYDVQNGQRSSPSASSPVAPAGFAAFRKAGRFQAASPDGAVYRVRSVRHKPKADLGFWQEALRNRMIGAGYHLLAEQEIKTADGGTGVLFELGAVNGERDQTYFVALIPDGSKLILVEATGEAEAFKAHREAVLAAIAGLRR